MNIPSSILTLLAGITLTLVSFWFGTHHGLLPVAASEEAGLIDSLFNAMMTISVGLFILVQGIIILAAFKFRQRPGDDTDAPPVHGNIPLEILWTAIPVVIVLGISVYSFEIYGRIGGLNPMGHDHQMAQVAQGRGSAIAAPLPATENRNQAEQDQATQDPATAAVRNEMPQLRDADDLGITSPRIGPTPGRAGTTPEFVVNATGLQYAWIFTYPDSGIVSGELHLPVNREVKVNISANDVIHAFWVPEFRLKQDAVPGRQTEVRFTPNKVGEYPVICAELCGAYHGAMKTRAIVQTAEAFDAWLDSQKVASGEGMGAAIATNPTSLPPDQFLAPYAHELGIGAATLHHLEATHPAAS